MDSENTNPVSPTPSSLPSGMSSGSQAELNKANWALGLGIASFFCGGCFTCIPALIIGLPVMKNAQSPEARSRAKMGVIIGGAALAFSILMYIVLAVFFMATLKEEGVDFFGSLDQEIHQLDQQIRKSKAGPFDDEET